MCGGALGECQDAEKAWYPQRLVCYKTLELISAQRKYAELHKALPYHDGSFEEWVAEPSASHPFKYDEAMRIWVSEVDYDPEGTWLSGRQSQQGPERDEGDEST